MIAVTSALIAETCSGTCQWKKLIPAGSLLIWKVMFGAPSFGGSKSEPAETYLLGFALRMQKLHYHGNLECITVWDSENEWKMTAIELDTWCASYLEIPFGLLQTQYWMPFTGLEVGLCMIKRCPRASEQMYKTTNNNTKMLERYWKVMKDSCPNGEMQQPDYHRLLRWNARSDSSCNVLLKWTQCAARRRGKFCFLSLGPIWQQTGGGGLHDATLHISWIANWNTHQTASVSAKESDMDRGDSMHHARLRTMIRIT